MSTFAEEDLFGSSSEEDEAEVVEDTLANNTTGVGGKDAKELLLESLLPQNYNFPSQGATLGGMDIFEQPREKCFDDNFSTPFNAKETLLYRHGALGFKGDFAGGERGGGRGFVALEDIYPGTGRHLGRAGRWPGGSRGWRSQTGGRSSAPHR